MDVAHWKDCPDQPIATFPYKGRPLEVRGTSVRWLSRSGDDGAGAPEYGLRLFTIQPGGQIPIHAHFYLQTMFILTGRFECWQFDPRTDEVLRRVEAGPGDYVYIPSQEPHGMRNLSATEAGTFLCCICNVYPDDAL